MIQPRRQRKSREVALELQELKAFIPILEHGTFQRAASTLGVTQSAISQALANLERKAGVKLLDRGKPVRATPIGNRLLHHARAMLSHEQEIRSELSLMKVGHTLELSLAIDYLAEESFVADLLRPTLLRFPAARLRLHRFPAREIIRVVGEGLFRFGLGPFQRDMPGLKTLPLFSVTSQLVAGRLHPGLDFYQRDPQAFLAECTLPC